MHAPLNLNTYYNDFYVSNKELHITKKGSRIWYYTISCKCGKVFIRPATGFTKRKCCRFCTDIEKQNGVQTTASSEHFPRHFMRRLYMSATARGLSLSLTAEFLEKLYHKQQGKCALSGRELIVPRKSHCGSNENHISIDRIDSDYGYAENNVQLVAAIINRIKNKYSQTCFLSICKEITYYTKGI